MRIKELRILVDGTDLVEQWVIEGLPKLASSGREVIVPEEINRAMEEFYRSSIKDSDQPLLNALEVAIETLPPTYVQFSDMLEVRYHDALKQITLR